MNESLFLPDALELRFHLRFPVNHCFRRVKVSPVICVLLLFVDDTRRVIFLVLVVELDLRFIVIILMLNSLVMGGFHLQERLGPVLVFFVSFFHSTPLFGPHAIDHQRGGLLNTLGPRMAKFGFLRETSRMVGVHQGGLLGLILGMGF